MKKTIEEHNKDVVKIQKRFKDRKGAFASLKRSEAKTHCTRRQSYKGKKGNINLNSLNKVISIDRNIAIVEPLVTMEKLIRKTKEHGVRPYVVPEFRGITVGGAISGGGLESTSHLYGLFENRVLWFDILIGSGEVVRCSKDENSDLFYGAMWSMGSLGYILLIALELKPCKPLVYLHYEEVKDREKAVNRLRELSLSSYEFVECIVYKPDQYLMIYGDEVENENISFSMNRYWHPWFYKHVQEVFSQRKEDIIPLEDYLFRHDRGIFWLGENKMKPTKLNRALFGWLFTMEMHHRTSRLKKDRNNESRRFLADFGPPLNYLSTFCQKIDERLSIYPLWWLPFKIFPQNQKIFSPDYICDQADFIVDVGVYGVPQKRPFDAIKENVYFEKNIHSIGGMKGFETVCYYDEVDFWNFFNKDKYDLLRKKYGAEGIFINLFNKVTAIT